MTSHPRNTEQIVRHAHQKCERAYKASTAALRDLVRARAPITFRAVADRAGVSTRYLSQHPELGPKIRQHLTSRTTSPASATAAAPAAGQDGVVAALRTQMRAMQAAHHEEVSRLRRQVTTLESAVATLTEALLDHTDRRGP